MGDPSAPSAAEPGPDGHDRHDPELIVALLDRDLRDADRAVGEARIAACASCAALHDDLVALAKASLELPIPARSRDFALPPSIAATLVNRSAGEPVLVGARQTGDMTRTRSRHDVHDRLLIANLVDRSVSDSERARADEQLAACDDCSLLYQDLVALSIATREMSVPYRRRDFTLTPADADRLRVRGWRRLLAAIGSSRDVFSRPLAVGLTTLGIAGLLVATIPNVLMGSASSAGALSTGNTAQDVAGGPAPNPEFMTSEASGTPPEGASDPAAVAAAPSAAAEPAPAASDELGAERQQPDGLFVGGDASPLPGEPDTRDLYRTSLADDGAWAPSTMVIVAGVLLLAGLGLFLLRWTARRLDDG